MALSAERRAAVQGAWGAPGSLHSLSPDFSSDFSPDFPSPGHPCHRHNPPSSLRLPHLQNDRHAAVHHGVQHSRRPPVAREGEAEGRVGQALVVRLRVLDNLDARLVERAVERQVGAAAAEVRRAVAALVGGQRGGVAEEGVRPLPQVVRVASKPLEADLAGEEDEGGPLAVRLSRDERFREGEAPEADHLPRGHDQVLRRVEARRRPRRVANVSRVERLVAEPVVVVVRRPLQRRVGPVAVVREEDRPADLPRAEAGPATRRLHPVGRVPADRAPVPTLPRHDPSPPVGLTTRPLLTTRPRPAAHPSSCSIIHTWSRPPLAFQNGKRRRMYPSARSMSSVPWWPRFFEALPARP